MFNVHKRCDAEWYWTKSLVNNQGNMMKHIQETYKFHTTVEENNDADATFPNGSVKLITYAEAISPNGSVKDTTDADVTGPNVSIEEKADVDATSPNVSIAEQIDVDNSVPNESIE